MVLRVLFIVLSLAAMVGAAFVFEAASQTKIALELAQTAQTSDSREVRIQILDRGAHAIEESWARPALWHAGANEVLSATYAQAGAEQGGDLALYDKSARAAARAVRLSPVQPHTWTRLAAFAAMGRPNLPCTLKECLERSWISAPMTDPETECVRLRLAHQGGLLTGPKDVRITAFAASGAPRKTIARCLAFLAPEDLFQVLLTTR